MPTSELSTPPLPTTPAMTHSDQNVTATTNSGSKNSGQFKTLIGGALCYFVEPWYLQLCVKRNPPVRLHRTSTSTQLSAQLVLLEKQQSVFNRNPTPTISGISGTKKEDS